MKAEDRPIKKSLICVVCPRGCRLEAVQDGDRVSVSGNFCPRGIPYANAELRHPERLLTATVAIEGAALPLLPVKTSRPVPLARLGELMRHLRGLRVAAPVRRGDVLFHDLLGTGADLVATRGMAAERGGTGCEGELPRGGDECRYEYGREK